VAAVAVAVVGTAAAEEVEAEEDEEAEAQAEGEEKEETEETEEDEVERVGTAPAPRTSWLAETSSTDATPGVFNNLSLRTAIAAWLVNPARALSTYGPIGRWNVSHVTNLAGLFAHATGFNEDISAWDVSHVVTMQGLFHGATAFNQPLSLWNVSQVVDMRQMFRGATAFNHSLASWDTSRVTKMSEMFWGATRFNRSLFTDVSRVTTMGGMFYQAKAFNQPLTGWEVGGGGAGGGGGGCGVDVLPGDEFQSTAGALGRAPGDAHAVDVSRRRGVQPDVGHVGRGPRGGDGGFLARGDVVYGPVDKLGTVSGGEEVLGGATERRRQWGRPVDAGGDVSSERRRDVSSERGGESYANGTHVAVSSEDTNGRPNEKWVSPPV
jgi:hypothetical protein